MIARGPLPPKTAARCRARIAAIMSRADWPSNPMLDVYWDRIDALDADFVGEDFSETGSLVWGQSVGSAYA